MLPLSGHKAPVPPRPDLTVIKGDRKPKEGDVVLVPCHHHSWYVAEYVVDPAVGLERRLITNADQPDDKKTQHHYRCFDALADAQNYARRYADNATDGQRVAEAERRHVEGGELYINNRLRDRAVEGVTYE